MKVRNVTIGIKSEEESLKDFVRTFKSIQAGHPPKKLKEGVYFVSREAMRKVLSPKRLEILSTVRKKEPGSIYELARILKRSLRNVQDDVSLLSRLGLLSLTRKREARKRIIPRVSYDRLDLQIPVV